MLTKRKKPMILNNPRSDYKEIFTTPNNTPRDKKMKPKLGRIRLVTNKDRDQLTEESKKISTDKLP